MHRLRIILEVATRGVQSGFKTASGAVRSFLGSLSNMASRGRRFIDGLAQSVFFLGKAFGMLRDAARAVFDRFIGGAGDAAKLEAKLKNIVGSSADAARIMEFLDQVAQQTGADFQDLARGAGLMAVAAKDASGAFDFDKFARLSDLLQRIAALRPDVPLDRLARGLAIAVGGDWASLELFLDVNLRQLVDIADAAEDVADVPEQIGKAATFIELGVADAADDALKSIDLLEEALTKAGATAGIVRDIAELSGMERFNETLQSIARTLGEPLFEALNEGAAELAGWLQENPELIDEFATALGKLGAAGIEKVFEAITTMLASTDWEKFFGDATKFLELLTAGDIEGAFEVVGLGDLGDDLKDTVASLGDIAKALGLVADWILVISGQKPVAEAVGEGFEQIGGTGKAVGDVGKDVAAKFERDFDTMVAPLTDWIEDLATRVLTPLSLAAAEPQKVEVEITLDNALLGAQIVQGAEETTVRAFDEVHQNYRRQNR